MNDDELLLRQTIRHFLRNNDMTCLRLTFKRLIAQYPDTKPENEVAFSNFRKNGHREALLRLPDVMKKVGLKRSTIYKKIQQKKFPAPIKIGERASAWAESEIAAWISAHKDMN